MLLPSSSSYTDYNLKPIVDGSPYNSLKMPVPGASFQIGQPVPTHGHRLPMIQAPSMAYMDFPQQVTGYALPSTTVLATSKQKDCQQECANEGCLDEDRFGAESKAPSEEWTLFGFDLKPLLPGALAASTVIGGICMLLVQVPVLSRFAYLSESAMSAGFGVLYGLTLGCMTYCTFFDPGQMRKTKAAANSAEDAPWQGVLPKRAHKSWQYPRPVRRYDHYCKWLQNVVGLLNHREFVMMLGGLALISVLGIIVDLWVALLMAREGFIGTLVTVLLHLAYSIILLGFAGPICRIHIGLIARNELAQEWKNNDHFVAKTSSKGENIPVSDLDDDEYNELFDSDVFVYERSRNEWDEGCPDNCFMFWCHARWPKDEKGEW
eukprot:TRINITY_DN30553_c0_g1_i1.p1 TRINITY_DN30553_c0_g1~~TRINITY_DN30553_c0_g1_i1.p1  ORF type:complete len:378 (-),score=51.81 TRINITY_DN30553_c0_g1_i1:306-1439(-)